jgi:hypothetical protein
LRTRWQVVLLMAMAAVAVVSTSPQAGAVGLRRNQPTAGFTVGAPVTKVSATFVVPSFTCSGKQKLEITVGILASSGATAEGYVTVSCLRSGASPRLTSVACTSATLSCTGRSDSVSVGDAIRVSVSQTKSASTARLVDVTARRTQVAVKKPGASSIVGAMTVNRQTATIPSFSKVAFVDAEINGAPLGKAGPKALVMTNKDGISQVTTSALSKAGTSFSTIFRHT